MKKVCVTGADGFIGSHLVEQLVRDGQRVKALVYYNSFNNWGWLENLDDSIKDSIEIVLGDVRDPNGMRDFIQGQNIVFHLAALIGIPYSYHSPDMYVETNIRGTLNVLQACRDFDVERVLVTSTSEVYGTAQYAPIDEKHPRQPQSPYSATKIAADAMAESFYRSFNLPVSIVRPFNTYGPRQSSRAFIPTVITQLLAGKDQLQLGDTTPTRDLVFVEDTVRAFMVIADSELTIGGDYNIATGQEYSVGDVAQLLIDAIRPEAVIQHDRNRVRPKKSEVFRLLGDPQKLQKVINWRPEISMESGLKTTIEWFQEQQPTMNFKENIYHV